MKDDPTPHHLREGVRAGILGALHRDSEHRGGRTARLLVGAGFVGVFGALGVTLLISGHPFGHHAPWHVTLFALVWSGLLIVSLSLAFLEVRTPTLPIAHAARVGILGLGLAGVCGAVCPDQHFLHWWSATRPGGEMGGLGGLALSALCFGGASTLFIGAAAAFVVLGGPRRVRPLLPAIMLLLLLAPGVALQSVGTSWGVFWAWLAGTGGGSYGGVAAGIRLRALLRNARPAA